VYRFFMAYIVATATQTYIPLAPHHTFGRLADSVDTHIDKPYVSKLHAAIEWNGSEWRIKNLGLNGTWLNTVNLPAGESVALTLKDVLHFAELTDPAFKVIDLSPPTDMLWPLDIAAGTSPQPIYLTRYHLLPDAYNPELALYFDEQNQEWQIETLDEQQEHLSYAVKNGDVVQLEKMPWQLLRAQIYGPTEAHSLNLQQLNDMEFVFKLSLDEEATQLELVCNQQKVDLAIRNHHYLLAQLARHRADDAALGLESINQGWVYTDILANELGLDNTHMNIYIFRLRKQIADALPTLLGLQNLVERRGGKIRFGCNKFKIYKGGALVLELPLVMV